MNAQAGCRTHPFRARGHLDSLDALRRAKARALRTLWDEAAIGIASHQVDVFILELVTDRYLGRLCDFNACPKGKAQCGAPGCGDVALLRQHEGGVRWRAESLAEGRAVRLFERPTGLQRRASDLPLLDVEAGCRSAGRNGDSVKRAAGSAAVRIRPTVRRD